MGVSYIENKHVRLDRDDDESSPTPARGAVRRV
jgi:hypothetical protein